MLCMYLFFFFPFLTEFCHQFSSFFLFSFVINVMKSIVKVLCFGLSYLPLLSIAAYYLPQNAGDIARKFIKDPEVLSFIDAEVGWHYSYCFWIQLGHIFLGKHATYFDILRTILFMVFLQCFIVSTVNALQTPMINASMVIFYIFFLAALYLILSIIFSHILLQLGSMWQTFWWN